MIQPSLNSDSPKLVNAFISHKLSPSQIEYRTHLQLTQKKKFIFPLAISGKPVWAKQNVYIIIALHFFPFNSQLLDENI